MNNKSVALNIFQINYQKVSHHYKSEINKTREKQVILLLITDNKKQHYLVVKNLKALLKKKTGHSTDYCLNCFNLSRNKSKFKTHKC